VEDQAARRAIIDLMAHALAHGPSATHIIRAGGLSYLLSALLSPTSREAPRSLRYFLRTLATSLLPTLRHCCGPSPDAIFPALDQQAAPDVAALAGALVRLHPSLLDDTAGSGDLKCLPQHPREEGGIHSAVFEFVDGTLLLLSHGRERYGNIMRVRVTAQELLRVVERWRTGGLEWCLLALKLVEASHLVECTAPTLTSEKCETARVVSASMELLIDLIASGGDLSKPVELVEPFVQWLQDQVLLGHLQRPRDWGSAEDRPGGGREITMPHIPPLELGRVLGEELNRVGSGLVWLSRHWAISGKTKTEIARALLPLLSCALRPKLAAEEEAQQHKAKTWQERGARWVRAISPHSPSRQQQHQRDELLDFAALVFAVDEVT